MNWMDLLRKGTTGLLAAAGVMLAANADAQVVISQVYGAGGNTGAAYNRDYVELFNQGYSSFSLDGHRLQYASDTGTFSATATVNYAFPAGTTIGPRRYLLVPLASGGANGVALPAGALTNGDVTAGTINMSATTGKVMLVNGAALTTNPTLPNANVLDFVGFGTTANLREGTPATTASNAPAPSAANAIFRSTAGCVDANQNSTDFAAAAASPRTSLTAQNFSCANDLNAPTITATVPASDGFTLAALASVSITFDEPMSAVPASSLTVNGSAATTVTGSSVGPYVFSGFTAPADGAVTIVLATTGVLDNQTQTLAGDFTRTGTINSVRPSVILAGANVTSGELASGAKNLTAEFSEGVTGLVAGDFTVTNGSVSNLVAVDADSYTFTLTPSFSGAVSVTLPASTTSAVALPNNPNTASNSFSWTNDAQGPRATTYTGVGATATTAVGVVTVNFNEPIFNFTLADVRLTKGFSTVDLTGLPITFTSGSTSVSLDLTAFTADDDLYGLFVGQNSPSSTAVDQFGQKVSSPAVISWIKDTTAPAVTLTGPVDNTIIGTTSTLTFSTNYVNGVNFGNTPVAAQGLEVQAPGASGYAAAGLIASGNTFNVSFATPGRYRFRYFMTDTAGNRGEATYTYHVNTATNAAMTVTQVAGSQTHIFPMTDSLNISLEVVGTPGGTITLRRVAGPIVTSPGTGINHPDKLIAEYLEISESGLGSFVAELVWNYDPASVGSVTINRLFRVNGGAVTGSFAVSPSGDSVTYSGITGFSDWYLGDSTASVADWTIISE